MEAGMISFQERVAHWVINVFGRSVLNDKQERVERFIEEALELGQACALPKERVELLLSRVYSREPGEIKQEIGGVCVTLAALGHTNGILVSEAAHTELCRIENRNNWPKLIKSHNEKPKRP